jgi:hypothetical protein
VQSFPSVLIDDSDLDNMGQKEISALVEKLTGRVTALEKKRASTATTKEKWGKETLIAAGILLLAVITLPFIIVGFLEPHLHNDLKSDVKNEVTDQLKEPLQDLHKMATDIAEIKGKLEVLDPLIQKLTAQRIDEAAKLNSKELTARLPELKHLAMIAKKENVTIKPETVENVGRKLVETGRNDAWDAALDFLSYKSFLNASLSLSVTGVQGQEMLYTEYTSLTPTGAAPPKFSVAGIVPKEQAAEFTLIGKPDLNESRPKGNSLILLDGGALTLDGTRLKNVVFRNVYIVYDGGPLIMNDVYFINCTFQMKRNTNEQKLLLTALSPSPAVTFDAS